MITSQLAIRELQLNAIIGVHAHERLQMQPLLLDLTIDIDITKAAASDQLDNTLDYASLVSQLIAWTAEQQFELLESLAYYLFHKIKQYPAVQKLHLTLSKFPGDLPIKCASIVLSTENNK